MEFLEVPLFDDDIFKLLVRFALNGIFLTLFVFLAIRPAQRNREFEFTAVMMNVTVFFMCFAMKKLDLGLGMALGLFAIFGVLRYRTDAIGIQEMTYLFIVIGLAVINSLSNKNTSYLEVFAVNTLILICAITKQRYMGKPPVLLDEPDKKPPKIKDENGKAPKYTLDYDNLELLDSAHRDQLLQDLKARTGINVTRVAIQHIDLPNRRATLTVWPESELSS